MQLLEADSGACGTAGARVTADCWAMLSMMYRGEYAPRIQPSSAPDPLDRALRRPLSRAIEAAPTNHLAYYAKATALFFQKERHGFRMAAEQNHRAQSDGWIDNGLSCPSLIAAAEVTGTIAGCALMSSAMQLNPKFSRMVLPAHVCKCVSQGGYPAALDAALRVNLPGYFHGHSARAATFGQLGCIEDAQKALREVLALRPNFASEARHEYAKWYDRDQVEQLVDGLRKAGLDIPDESKSVDAASVSETATSADHIAPSMPVL